MGRVATNISFLYFLENDMKLAEKYSEMALNYDRYNAKVIIYYHYFRHWLIEEIACI